MAEISANSKRIAKNTLMLYSRMLLMMVVMLYTSRIVLNALGVDDYGIHNVIGGVVAMFSVVSNSLSSAISRFITFELGRGDQGRLNTVFSSSLVIQIAMSVVVVLLVESVGIWFLENKMVISPDRMVAARWVLQLSLLTLIIRLVAIPYNAAIVAHEKMSAFAYIGIFEGFATLAIAYAISVASSDRLILYSALMALLALAVRIVYSVYCRRHFEECKFRWLFDGSLLKEMFGFAGWNFIGSSSQIFRDQGGNILLNTLGGGVAVNAAMGIASQVKGAIMQFSSNFMMALNPQITKSYASGDHAYMMTIIFQGARLSFYMLLMLSLPIIIFTPYVLTLWLNVVPEHSVSFVRLALIFGMCESISAPMITAMLATGKIRNYQLLVGGLQMLNLPLAYLFLKLGFFPEVVLLVAIFISVCCLSARLFMLRGMIKLPAREFVKRVFLNVLLVSIVAAILPVAIASQIEVNFIKFCGVTIVSVISTAVAIYFVGCNAQEREYVKEQLRRRLKGGRR